MVQRIILYLPELLTIRNIIVLLCLVTVGALFYLMASPNAIEMSVQSYMIVANGVSPEPVSVTVTSMLGIPLPGARVDFSADRGYMEKLSCTTNSAGGCTVNFIPEKSLGEQRATITASIGGLSDNVLITMAPDNANSIALESQQPFLLADGYSSTSVTALVTDNVGNAVPDGTRVSFTVIPPEMGTFSRGGLCNTNNGKCTISFTSSVNPGNATLTGASNGASGSVVLDMLTLLPEKMEVVLSSISVPADGQKTILVTVRASDELGNPVPGQEVTVDVALGTLDNEMCKTDDTGECSFTYLAGTETGTDDITANIEAHGLSASRPLLLLPVSNLDITMLAYENVGNPIIPAFVRSIEFHGHDMARIIITNEGNSLFEGTVSLEVPGWSEQGNEQVSVEPGEIEEIFMTLPLKQVAYDNLDAEPVHYLLSVRDNEGKEVFRNTYYTTLAPFNTMVWGGVWDYMIAAWDTPSAPAIHELVSEAADYTPWESIIGYQEMTGYTHAETTYFQLKALYDTLADRGMRYVNAPYALEGMQTVYTPVQSLEVNGANCIDGSMVFASALTSMGMNPLIVLTTNHAFVCVQDWPGSDSILCLETTMVGHSEFRDAVESGADQFEDVRREAGFRAINANSAIENGVKPLPS
ncbi:MAG: Ig-like domain-containing protein [Candidatus Micrarchaeota archaeon]